MSALSIYISGIVQGVGFRPFVYRLAHQMGLTGWVTNTPQGVEIHVEGQKYLLQEFTSRLGSDCPEAAQIQRLEVEPAPVQSCTEFVIAPSTSDGIIEAGISPDLALCRDCLRELFDPTNPRYHYPYITCTHCGPRYSIVLGLPYDRAQTTMNVWELCSRCEAEYHHPLNRRFHAQPVACPDCGPEYYLQVQGGIARGSGRAIKAAAERLCDGQILAVKGIGGYHLVCDAMNADAVRLLRQRKFRKDKPFAIMADSLETAQMLCMMNEEEQSLLTSSARPIVLLSASEAATFHSVPLPLVELSPDSSSLGVMLPYTPLHFLLFEALQKIDATRVLVMTSANRSSEPICYRDNEALERLSGIADAFLIGERPIARRVEDSVVRSSPIGTVFVRRSRGYAPSAVAQFPMKRGVMPCLAVGGDLKNTVTLAINGQAFTSQFIGDLEQAESVASFRETIDDLLTLYHLSPKEIMIAHDAHTSYISTLEALAMPAQRHISVQHHKAHIASVLAERGECTRSVVGIAFDGTGFGEDGVIWGGEAFVGSLESGFERVGHLRTARLVGGDAAARHPVQAASGFLAEADMRVDFSLPPFSFPSLFNSAQQLLRANLRVFPTSSVGRLFDAVAALLGFTRAVAFEGQAAMWLEYLASASSKSARYHVPMVGAESGFEWDWRPMFTEIVRDVQRGKEKSMIARGFHAALAEAIVCAAMQLCQERRINTIALSGGVFQNMLLVQMIARISTDQAPHLTLWTNNHVPSNDGGISLGQAALAVS